MKTDVTLRDVTSIRVERRDDDQFWMRFGDYSYEMVTIFAEGEARETLARWADEGAPTLLKQRDALREAMQKLVYITPDRWANESGDQFAARVNQIAHSALACSQDPDPHDDIVPKPCEPGDAQRDALREALEEIALNASDDGPTDDDVALDQIRRIAHTTLALFPEPKGGAK